MAIKDNHVSGTPLTTQITSQASAGLLRSEVDRRIAQIRPSSTPLDQISRIAGARSAGSMEVEYYSVDLKAGVALTTGQTAPQSLPKDESFTVGVDDPTFLAESDTVMFPGVKTPAGAFLLAYVTGTEGKSVHLEPLNVDPDEDDERPVPAIPKGARVVRMGRAASELDVQTSQFTVVPVKSSNYCQIFKAQIEESMLHRASNKEVGWNFSDQEEAAIVDMRMCMERSFLFGKKHVFERSAGDKVMLTGGIWHQTDHELRYSTIDKDTVITLMRRAFSESNGSSRKVLLAGSDLLEQINRLDVEYVVSGSNRLSKWGVDFGQLVSKFGSLYVVRSEVFDMCGMEGYGMVIDPEYITKYTHIPFSAERISLHKQGLRNTEAIVLTEASCLVLRYPKAHMRIVPQA